jgi:hypothetical protein
VNREVIVGDWRYLPFAVLCVHVGVRATHVSLKHCGTFACLKKVGRLNLYGFCHEIGMCVQ